ncbi:MAG: hypothetical protein WD468_06810 [Pirellulales bacterium]
MAAVRWIKYCYLAYLSQPKCERELYRLVKARQVSRIVEVGISNVARSTRLIEVAQRYADDQKVCYTGLDWFDARGSELTTLTLKQVHCALQLTGAQVRLIPGPPGHSLAAAANAHQNTDLIIVSPQVSDDDLFRAWYYVPRMLRDQSVVLREHDVAEGQSVFAKLSASELAERAGQSAPRRAA